MPTCLDTLISSIKAHRSGLPLSGVMTEFKSVCAFYDITEEQALVYLLSYFINTSSKNPSIFQTPSFPLGCQEKELLAEKPNLS
jgi:hypothetical protein